MRVIFKIYRTAKVATEHLKSAVGLEADAPNDVASEALKEKFGPHMAYSFKVFWPDPEGYKTTIVGMAAMGFELEETDGTPKAAEGLVTCDPIDEETTHRVDGALRSELQRLGLWTEADDYEWRGWFEIKE